MASIKEFLQYIDKSVEELIDEILQLKREKERKDRILNELERDFESDSERINKLIEQINNLKARNDSFEYLVQEYKKEIVRLKDENAELEKQIELYKQDYEIPVKTSE